MTPDTWLHIAIQAALGLLLIGMNYQVTKDLIRRVGKLEDDKTNKEAHARDMKNINDKIDSSIRDSERRFRVLERKCKIASGD